VIQKPAGLTEGDNGLGNPKFDTSLPDFSTVLKGIENANADGWYEVFTDNFDGTELNSAIWATSPHGMRTPTSSNLFPGHTSYWCPSMVTVKNGMVEIRSSEEKDHICPDGICPAEGRFTGGIETRLATHAEGTRIIHDKSLFEQAFGYFECRVKFPDETGLWSAFWLQSPQQALMGDEGRDGTEIDVYESAFIKNPTYMGHALLWNGYENGKVEDYRLDTGVDLYDGFHTFALKWTPEYYVFYIDGVATWATDAGGVSQTPEFLRFTVELDQGDQWGPHAQFIGKFRDEDSVFYIDYIKVYQNVNFSAFEIPLN
jgi:hypothetical protein